MTAFGKLLGAMALCGLVAVAGASTVQEDPLERQMLDIAKDLRCAVCQNQPVSESNSTLASDMRAIIRERLAAGQSRAEIVDYFVSRYGDYVLLNPPLHARGLLLWLGPPLLLVAAAVLAWVVIRRRAGVSPPPPPPRLSAEDSARVQSARRQDA